MNTSIIIWFFQLRQEEGVNLSLVVMHWIYLYYNFTTLYKICICFQLVPLSSFRHCWAGGDDDDHYFSNSCYASYMADTHHCSAEFCGSLPGIGVDFLFISFVECNRWKLSSSIQELERHSENVSTSGSNGMLITILSRHK